MKRLETKNPHSISAEAMEWLDRYVNAVGEALPNRQRADIETEIRANLIDELESANQGRRATREDAIDMLNRLPPPLEMAQRYGATQSLIGPAIYNTYSASLRMVVVVVLVVHLTGIVAIALAGGTLSISGTLWTLFVSLLAAMAIVTLVFVVAERSGSGNALAGGADGRGWNARALPPAHARDRATFTDMTTDIVTVLVSLLWLTFYVGSDGAIAIYSGAWVPFPVLSSYTVTFVGWLSAVWVAQLALYILVVARRRWSALLRWTLLALLGAEAMLLGWLLRGTALAAIPQLEWVVRVVVLTMLVVTMFSIIGQLWALWKNRTVPVDSAQVTMRHA